MMNPHAGLIINNLDIVAGVDTNHHLSHLSIKKGQRVTANRTDMALRLDPQRIGALEKDIKAAEIEGLLLVLLKVGVDGADIINIVVIDLAPIHQKIRADEGNIAAEKTEAHHLADLPPVPLLPLQAPIVLNLVHEEGHIVVGGLKMPLQRPSFYPI